MAQRRDCERVTLLHKEIYLTGVLGISSRIAMEYARAVVPEATR